MAPDIKLQFPDVGLPAVVSALSNLNLHSSSQQHSAFAALSMFHALNNLRFDPAIRAMRKFWNPSSPQHACFWSGKSLIVQLAEEPIDLSSWRSQRDRLIIVLRLLHLYRSIDLAPLLRLWATDPGGTSLFIAAKRKGWGAHRWERIMYFPERPLVYLATVLFRYIKVTKHVVRDLPSPCPVLVSLVKPCRALSALRVGALTKLVLQKHGIDVSFFGPHSTRDAGIDVH